MIPRKNERKRKLLQKVKVILRKRRLSQRKLLQRFPHKEKGRRILCIQERELEKEREDIRGWCLSLPLILYWISDGKGNELLSKTRSLLPNKPTNLKEILYHTEFGNLGKKHLSKHHVNTLHPNQSIKLEAWRVAVQAEVVRTTVSPCGNCVRR